MNYKLIIRGELDSPVLSVSLYQILSLIGVNNYNWRITWIHAIGEWNGMSILEFEELVNKSKYGYKISFAELLDLSKGIDEIIEIVVVADFLDDKSSKELVVNEGTLGYSIYIELVDSTFWEVVSKDKPIIDKIITTIPGAVHNP